MKTRQLLCALLLLLTAPAAAINHYTFRRSTAAYAPLTGDTVVAPIVFGSGDTYPFELRGQTMTFFNKTYQLDDTAVYVSFSTNGHLHIQDNNTFLIFDGLFHFLDSVDASSAVSYKIEGSGNDQIFKVQWKNLGIRDGAAGNFVNFQMWLYRATGAVEMRYGPSSANNASGYTNATGPNIGMFYSNKTFTAMYEKIWVNGLPAAATLDSAKNLVFNAVHGVPPDGTVYHFEPRIIADGIPGIQAGALQIYPNPAFDEIRVSVLEGGLLHLTDIAGRVLLSKEIQAGVGQAIILRSFPIGNYYLRFTSRTGSYTRHLNKR
jgi:hypothetical protein